MLSLTPLFATFQELDLKGAFLDNHDFSNQNSLESIYLESHKTDIYEIILAEFFIIFRIIWYVALWENSKNQKFQKNVCWVNKHYFMIWKSNFWKVLIFKISL